MSVVRVPVLMATLALAAVAGLAGLALVASPLLTAGAAAGVLLLAVTIAYPLPVVGAMLALGALDLSFLSGGSKALLLADGGLDMNGIRLVGIVIALGAIVIADRSVLQHVFARHGRWFLIFLLYAAATLIFSRSRLDGLRLLLKLAYPFLVFVAVLGVARTRRDLELLGDWALLGASVMVLVVNPLYVAFGGVHAASDGGQLRVGTIGLHENPFSFYLLALIFLALVRSFVRRQARYAVLAVVLATWMVLTFTRITLVASLLGLAAMGLYDAWSRRSYRMLGAGAVLGIGLLVALAPTVLQRTLGYAPTPGELAGLIVHPGDLVRSMDWQGRQALWPLILAQFRASPWLGLGLGSTTALLAGVFGQAGISVAHNEYLRLGAETGIVGVVLFAVAIGQWWRSTLGAARVGGLQAREFALAAVAMLVSWAVISLTDNAFDYYAPFTQYVGFYCAGAVLASAFAPSGAAAEGSDASGD